MKKISINIETMENKYVIIEGMTCNHCKQTIETNIANLEGIEKVEADISNNQVKISGNSIDLSEIKNTVSKLGYKYKGEL